LGGPAEPRPPAWLHAALAEARTEASAPERILLVDAPADLDSAAWRETLGLSVEAIRPGEASVPADPLDLLQQHYAPRARLAALKRAYIPAAALLAAWLAATLVFDAVEWARVSSKARTAEEEMRALLLKSFPETRAILDPAEQMRRGLEDLGARSGIAAPGDMLFLLARAAPAIERESRVRVQGMEYAERALIIRIAASEADAESLARTLRARIARRRSPARRRRSTPEDTRGRFVFRARQIMNFAWTESWRARWNALGARERRWRRCSPYPSARRFLTCSSGARSKAVLPRRAPASRRCRRSSSACRSRPTGWRTCVPRPRATPPVNLAAAVGQAAERHGLREQLKRVDAEGASAVRVQIEDAPFLALMAWLVELQQQIGLRAESAALERHANPGTVNGRLLLRAQGA